MAEIVGIGFACMDYVGHIADAVSFDDKPSPMIGFAAAPGGQVTTALVTAQRLGAQTAAIVDLAEDPQGADVIECLRREGVETDLVRISSRGFTPTVIILVREIDGRRAIFVRRGPDSNDGLTAADRRRIAGAKVLHLDGRLMNTALEAARWAREHGVIVSVDASSVLPGIDVLIGLTDYLVTSAWFPELFTGLSDYDAAARQLLDLGPSVVVVTLGENGSRTWTRECSFARSAFKVRAVDTTGAGDVFHGAYIYGITRGWDLGYLADFASAAAAMKCRRLGGQAGIPTLKELHSFLAENGIRSPP